METLRFKWKTQTNVPSLIFLQDRSPNTKHLNEPTRVVCFNVCREEEHPTPF